MNLYWNSWEKTRDIAVICEKSPDDNDDDDDDDKECLFEG